MTKTRRAGRRYQLRRIVSTHLVPGYNLQLYLGIEPTDQCAEPYTRVTNRRSAKAYNVVRIAQPPLPDLPAEDLPRHPGDPRPTYYARLREALVHYAYGGATPTSQLPDEHPWPRKHPGSRRLRTLVRASLTTSQVPVVTLD